jgi:N-methylhydantoinase A
MAGALSALGMLLADRTRDYSAGALGAADIEARFRRLEKQARTDMRGAALERFVDLRYAGQSYELTVPWASGRASAAFHKEHQRIYGYSDSSRAVQIVTLRLRATLPVNRPSLRLSKSKRKPSTQSRRVWIAGRWRECLTGPREIFRRTPIAGPAIVTDYGSTTLIPPGWAAQLDAASSLILRAK